MRILTPLLIVSSLLLASCATLGGLRDHLTPQECALRLQQVTTIEEAARILSNGGLSSSAVNVIIQALVDGRTTLEIACQIANDPEAVRQINAIPVPEELPQPAPTPAPVI